MPRLNKAQQQALLRVYQRTPLYRMERDSAPLPLIVSDAATAQAQPDQSPMTYRDFRRLVQFASYDSCVMVPWCGMWLGIEQDGYTHS